MQRNKQRKKYQLKYKEHGKLNLLKESDRLYDLLVYIYVCNWQMDIDRVSLWMDGKVLD